MPAPPVRSRRSPGRSARGRARRSGTPSRPRAPAPPPGGRRSTPARRWPASGRRRCGAAWTCRSPSGRAARRSGCCAAWARHRRAPARRLRCPWGRAGARGRPRPARMHRPGLSSVPWRISLLETEAPFGETVERPPHQAIAGHDHERHDADAQHDARIVAGSACFGDVGAEAGGLELGVAPARHLGDDAGVPRAARRGERAGDVVRQDPGQDDLAPPLPGAQAKQGRDLAQVGREGAGAGDDVEQDVPLRAQHHQRAEPDVGIEAPGDDDHDRHGEQHVGREGRQELRHRLHARGRPRTQPDPDADRHPDDAGQRNQDRDAEQGQQAEPDRRQHVAGAERGAREQHDVPQRVGDDGKHDQQPQAVGQTAGSGTAHGPRRPREAQRQLRYARGHPADGRRHAAHHLAAPPQIVDPGARTLGRGGLLEAELIGPRHDRPEQQLVIGQDHRRHDDDGQDHRMDVLGVDRDREPRADARQLHRGVADRDRLRGDDEEPAARHRHHRIPDQAGRGERHLEPPETQPGRELEMATHLVEIGRHRAQRLVEAERHVPGLGGEDREDRRAFGAELAAGKQPHENSDREGEEAEHRHRLQDIERRHDDEPRLAAFRGERCHDERERQRRDDRGEHAQRGAQRIFGQVCGSSVTGATSSRASGSPISRAAWATSTKAAAMPTKTMQS